MTVRGRRRRVALAAFVLASAACGAEQGAPPSGDRVEASPAALEPSGLRRLTEPEYRATLVALLGESASGELGLPPAPRQRGFSRNAMSSVDVQSVVALHELVAKAAASAVRAGGIAELEACGAVIDRDCATRFIAEFGRRAFRRPLSSDEAERYLALFEAGAEGTEPLAGIELVVATLLESPELVYARALGENARDGVVRLTSHEIASELSFAIAARPPDAELAELAEGDALFDAEIREHEARRLLRQSETRFHYRRFVDEWLELDRLPRTAKDLAKYPDFLASRVEMAREAAEFVDRAMIEHDGAFSALVAGEAGGRRGLLELPAFLSVHAHPASSAPVLRGATVLRRVLCREFPTPEELGVEVTAPPPDATATTRERFEAHASDPSCAGCHAEIDPVGGLFEAFDAVGEMRGEDAGKPVDTAGSVTLDGIEQPLPGSGELAVALAGSEEARSCFARQVFRYLSARDDEPAERAFVDAARALAVSRRESLVELAVFYVSSERFVRRRSEP